MTRKAEWQLEATDAFRIMFGYAVRQWRPQQFEIHYNKVTVRTSRRALQNGPMLRGSRDQ